MKELIEQTLLDVNSMLESLRASEDKYVPFDHSLKMTPGQLEPYDAMCARFERVSDIIMNQLFAILEIYWYGDKSQNLRDRLLRMEKGGYIDDAEMRYEIRLIRNKIEHAYLPEQLADIYEAIARFFPVIVRPVTKASEQKY